MVTAAQLVERVGQDGREHLEGVPHTAPRAGQVDHERPANDARGAWLLAKVQLLVGQPELSLRYADRCMSICEEHGLADFDLAYAYEARARALKVLGDDVAAAQSWETAKSVPIANPEDRSILDADLAVGL